jgi:hypothetical protein
MIFARPPFGLGSWNAARQNHFQLTNLTPSPTAIAAVGHQYRHVRQPTIFASIGLVFSIRLERNPSSMSYHP